MQSKPSRRRRTPIARTKVDRGIWRRTTKEGVRYEVAYLDAKGEQRWQTVDRLADARRIRGDLVAKVARGEVVAPTKTTFAELAEGWHEARSARLRPRTARYYRDALDLVLLPRFGRQRLSAIDADAVVKLTRDLEREGLHAIDPERPVRPLGRSSVTNYLKPLQGILALAARRKLIQGNPFDLLIDDDRPLRPEGEEPHEWSTEQVDALVDASVSLAAREVSKYDYSLLLRVAAILGLRKGEALGLTWADFDKEDGYLSVERQWTQAGTYGPPKTKAGVRRIALPADLRDALIAHRLQSAFSLDEHPIFASVTGTPLGHRNVSRRGFEPARDLAGLPSHLTFHDLRHASASRLIDAGLDAVTVAAVLGHEDATTTLRIYAHRFDRAKKDEKVREAFAGGG